MAIHHKKLESAVKKYGPIYAEKGEEETLLAMAADDKLTVEERGEVLAALTGAGEGEKGSNETKGETQAPPPAAETPASGVKPFEKFKVEPVYKFKLNEDTGDKERYLSHVEKIGNALSVHHMEQSHANELNSQVENSRFWYFEKENA